MSVQDLQRLGTVSAGNKEESIFRVFAYLNTRGDFSPIEIKQKVLVKTATVIKYLRTIQKAQFFNKDYKERLLKPFEEQVFGSAVGEQKELAERCLSVWRKNAEESSDDSWKEKIQNCFNIFIATILMFQKNRFTLGWSNLFWSMNF